MPSSTNFTEEYDNDFNYWSDEELPEDYFERQNQNKQKQNQNQNKQKEKIQEIKSEFDDVKLNLSWLDIDMNKIENPSKKSLEMYPKLSNDISVSKEKPKEKPGNIFMLLSENENENETQPQNVKIQTKTKSSFNKEEIIETEWNYSKRKEKTKNNTSQDSKPNYTKMCNFIIKGIECKHGKNCKFAHNFNELKLQDCKFGNSCKFIYNKNGKIMNKNSDERICMRIHNNESREDYLIRTKLQIQLTKEVPKVITKEVPKVITKNEETILKVPQNIAVQAMELAIKSGNKNIRVEII